MRVLVFGGRDFNNQRMAFKALDSIHATHKFSLVIHGDARGADTLAKKWAKLRHITDKPYPADWKNTEGRTRVYIKDGPYGEYDALAGFHRNEQMLKEGKPDIGVAFPGGDGTEDMKERLKEAGIKVLTVVPRN